METELLAISAGDDDAPARAALARAGLGDIPRMLMLQDRTPVSASYGSFDRDWWHVRVMDFPCGMAQECVLPLALAWALPVPGSRWCGVAALRDWVEAGIRHAAATAHPDGSCDDYYPFERASGAAAFSLLACLDASSRIGLPEDGQVRGFFRRRARWLGEHRESGELSNHEGLIVSCLQRMVEREGAPWEALLAQRLERLLSWQHEEGWFSEYGGADPGYLTLTIGCLADLDRRRPDLRLRPAIERAVAFVAEFVHPDGTLGGEYTSRGTVNMFPHGFEIAGAWLPLAAQVADRLAHVLAAGREPCVADDRLLQHHAWSRLWAWEERGRPERRAMRPPPLEPPAHGHVWPGAGLFRLVSGEARLWGSLTKGGAFRLYAGERLAHADTGPTLALADGRVAVAHLEGGARGEAVAEPVGGRFAVDGPMALARGARLTPFKSVVLRLVMLSLGRFFPTLVRRLLQRMLVTGRDEAPFMAARRLSLGPGALLVEDRVAPVRGWAGVRRIGVAGFQTSMTTVMARGFERAQFQPFEDWTERLAGLAEGEALVVQRRIEA